MAVGIVPQAAPEARVVYEMLFRYALHVVPQPGVDGVQLAQDLLRRQVAFLRHLLRVEGIDAAQAGVPWRRPAGGDQR